VSGWIAIVASGGVLASQLIAGEFTLVAERAKIQSWQQFLIYIAFTLSAFVINSFLSAVLPRVSKLAFIWSIVNFVVICTVLLATSPQYADVGFVSRLFINLTGWPGQSRQIFPLKRSLCDPNTHGIVWPLACCMQASALLGMMQSRIRESIQSARKLSKPLMTDKDGRTPQNLPCKVRES
jgi:hypothetical protein